MLRSLNSGVSGLRNHLVKMDVIGNNIANVNTIGFKTGRITFKDTMSQLLQGSTRPIGDLGGINPMQLGTGMSVGSIDNQMTQGGLESTGKITDLAIQGDGFFVISDGTSQYFTRSGAFQFDANGKLVSPTNGFAVQGRMADENGEIGSGAAVTDLLLPFGQKTAAQPTTELSLMGNLDSRSVKGTILDTSTVYGLELGGDDTDMNNLYAYGATDETISGLITNDTYVEVAVTSGGVTTTNKYYYNDGTTSVTLADSDGEFKSLDDLITQINADNALVQTSLSNGQVAFTPTAGNNDLTLVISSNHSSLNRSLSQANDSDLDFGETSTTDTFMHKAVSSDLLANLRNASGENLGITDGDVIRMNAMIGGTAVEETTLTVNSAATTYGNLVTALDNTLGIVNPNSITIDTKDGSMVVNGDGGTVNEITQLDIIATNAAGDTSRTNFDDVFSLNSGTWGETQSAVDGTHQATMTYYDSMGNSHLLTFSFSQDDATSNRWFWEGSVDSPSTIVGGSRGVIEFNNDGSLRQFQFDNDASSLQINSNNGSDDPISIALNAGTYSKFDGIIQGASPSTLIATGQDGYPMGSLENITISSNGEITGMYSNGINRTLAQIVLAGFNNPSGLLKTGDNMYQISNNSGDAIIGTAGDSVSSTVTPGALEMSNVDLATEFTSMIISQRGFQANARVISTSDDLLTELVSLKR